MANTCSYSINGTEHADTACFAIFRNSGDSPKIIIEEHKFSVGKELTEVYIKDLKKYFNFTYIYEVDKKRFILDLSNITSANYQQRILLGMFVRFLWEGYYNKESYNIDKFFTILPIYFKFKEYYPKTNRLKLLLIACNWFTHNSFSLNSNHFIGNAGCNCKVNIKVSNLTKQSISGFFISNSTTKVNKVELNTEAEYRAFYKLVSNN